MHLKQLKLAGFKSFVDPTTVHFPSQLVGIVGPNGCGKSNIIDAVRWVMGESSAKNLRGESMIDVIFNGSTDRKSVGQASVELLFDNSLGRLLGPFANYAEIAVKRIVTRSGDSTYYLNGNKCRRKDITDIFLGTGAGTRGYSIIGQGTVSRLVEAKPEELRAFLEEAAGVSLYKERRHETLLRIEHTRENLARVTDIRNELEKQLQRLERQAKSAERYMRLKTEEKRCRAEILAFKWKDFTELYRVKQHELSDLTLNYEREQSLLTGASKERILLNEKGYEVNQLSSHIQESFYQLATEIARLEETIQQQEREKKRLEQDKQQVQEELHSVESQIKQDHEEWCLCKNKGEKAERDLQQLKLELAEYDLSYQDTKKHQAQKEEQWQCAQLATNTLKSELQLSQIQLQHLEQKRQHLFQQIEKLNKEHSSISLDELYSAKLKLEEQQTKLKAEHILDEEQLQEGNERLSQLRLIVQESERNVHLFQDEFHRLNSDHAALMAAHKAAKQNPHSNKKPRSTLISKPQLVDILTVESDWQWVCDRVLADTLYAHVIDNLDELIPEWLSCDLQEERVVTMSSSVIKTSFLPKLADKVQGAVPAAANNLEHIYAAEDLNQALAWVPNLLDYESVVTMNGFWLGKGWAQWINPQEQDAMGPLVRQQKIAELDNAVKELQLKIEVARSQRDQSHSHLQHCSAQIEECRSKLIATKDALQVNGHALTEKEQVIHQATLREQQLTSDMRELTVLLEEINEEHYLLTEKDRDNLSKYQDSEVQLHQLLMEKNEHLALFAGQQAKMERVRTLYHQAELSHDREHIKLQQMTDRMKREKERLAALQKRLENIVMLCLQTSGPAAELQGQLAEHLNKQGELELRLTVAREQANQLRSEQALLEQSVVKYDHEVKRIQEAIGQTRIQEEAFSVRAKSIQESLDELGLNAEALLEKIPQDLTLAMKEDELITFSEKIKGLGAINLAAIEEFDTEQERKIYLDQQNNDLNDALNSLEMAIEQLDKETRLRLELTFNEVNTSFKALFPRLFGGGRAQLELTCDNLLEAGIVVMAQPPGKRNSTIHLLSGGEKAMTAVALIFAIFKLNPSPFCLLDEVDAPLDDTNIRQFCDLVKEMSQFVQFLFITHNKITMELAEHLIGVTMREPGVSRLVAVDVKQAVAME
jgi:chromosome segregation protein